MPSRIRTRSATPPPHWRVVEQMLVRHQRPPHRESAKPGAAPAPAIVYVMGALARQTAKLLAGSAPGESPSATLYWLGFEVAGLACVTTLIVPDAGTREDTVLTSAVTRDETMLALVDAPLVLLAACSRPQGKEPPLAGREKDAHFEGVLAVEIPPLDNGRFDPASCTVHRLIGGKRRRIPPRELTRHLRIIPGYRDLRKVPSAVSPRPAG